MHERCFPSVLAVVLGRKTIPLTEHQELQLLLILKSGSKTKQTVENHVLSIASTKHPCVACVSSATAVELESGTTQAKCRDLIISYGSRFFCIKVKIAQI